MTTTYLLPKAIHTKRPRCIHIAPAPDAPQTLCRKPVRSWWRQVAADTGKLCASCLQQMASRGMADVQLPPDTDADKRRRALLDKVGYKLALSPRQYQICVAMKAGHWWPKQITEATGITRQVVRVQLNDLVKKHGIGVPELREILPYIALVDPTKRKVSRPNVKLVHGAYVATYRGKYIGTWSTEAEAYAAGMAYIAGRPSPTPPRKRGDKPLVAPVKYGRWQVYVYDRQAKKRRYVCACGSEAEGIAIWEDARRNGVYTSSGFVAAWGLLTAERI